MTDESTHVLLGAGGAISQCLARELISQNRKVRLVSRSGFSLEGSDTMRANLLDADQTTMAISPGATVYLLAGLPYDRRVWLDAWPKIMQNVIAACKDKSARLIFFDNVYMYGRVKGPMTEETQYRPTSVKGQIRATIATRLQEEMAAGRLTASIARSADFYGPYADKVSLLHIFVLAKLAAGKKAQILVESATRHSFTYTVDCGKALRMLADDPDSFGQVWHLPTASPSLTSAQLVEIAAKQLGRKPAFSVTAKWMVKMGGIFDRTVKEVYEMLYQNKYDYIFDSSKFEERYSFEPTSYAEGIAATIEHYGLDNK